MIVYKKPGPSGYATYNLTERNGADFQWAEGGEVRHNNYPGHKRLVAEGWMLHEPPQITRFQRLGDLTDDGTTVTNAVVDYTRADILATVTSSVESTYDAKKDNITPTRKFRRAVTRAIDLIYREVKYHNYGLGTPLTQEEKLEMQYLGALAARTKALETAEVDIIIEAEGKTDEELQALPDDWETAHPDWTE